MLVKLKSSREIEYFPNWIQTGDKIYTNAQAEEIALKQGFKPLVIDEAPPYDEQTQYLDVMYVEESDRIRQIWLVKSFESEV